MIKSNVIIISVLSMIGLASCNNEKDNTDKEYVTQPINNPSTNAPTALDSALIQGANNHQGSQLNPTPTANSVQATTNNAAQPAAASAKGINPKHGQPGHRCDIPEGAPLNSPPGKLPPNQTHAPAPAKATVKPTTTTQPANNITVTPQPTPASADKPKPAPQKTDPAFVGKPNPEHGKPGHRCDLPVGTTLPE